mgnify:CR=1 FL=1
MPLPGNLHDTQLRNRQNVMLRLIVRHRSFHLVIAALVVARLPLRRVPQALVRVGSARVGTQALLRLAGAARVAEHAVAAAGGARGGAAALHVLLTGQRCRGLFLQLRVVEI